MSETYMTHAHRELPTYYVYGSGLIPVPHERVNEISKLKSEHHAEESRRGMMLAMAIRTA